MAFLIEKGQRCQMCGSAEWEWDPELGGRKFPYAPVNHECRGCAMIEDMSRQQEARPGVRVELMRSDDPQLQAQQERYDRIARRSRD